MSRDILRFTIRIFAMSLPVLGFAWFTFLQADGRTDPFYLRFTTPRQSSMIIGSSRAAQGILPEVIDSLLGRKGLFNYAMTISNSPYGGEYNASIEKKLNKNASDGLFLLEVSPWTLAISMSSNDELSELPENGSTICNPLLTNLNPNPFYLIENYQSPVYNLFGPGSTEMLLHENGWLEVNVPMSSDVVEKRRTNKLNYYGERALERKRSRFRLEALATLITRLAPFGQVQLVRLPCDSEMLLIEDQFWSDFNTEMETLSTKLNVRYINFTPQADRYIYTDGNHLWKESGRQFSIDLGKAIAAAP